MSRDSSRKPSGSSAHSATHSPTASPSNPHSSRRITPTTTGNMLSVGVGAPSGIMGINPGWNVWGGSQSPRNPSVSSAASANELSNPPSDSGYRGNLHEGWTASRPTSGSWDDTVAASPRMNELPQLDAQTQLGLQTSRQRPGPGPFPGQRIENRPSKLPAHHGIGSQQAGSQVSPTAGGYDSIQNTATTVEDLALSIRGMAVEDDFSSNRQQPQASHVPPQARPPFGTYNAFYSPQSRDSFGEYPYGYDAYRGPSEPSLYGSPALSNAICTVNSLVFSMTMDLPARPVNSSFLPNRSCFRRHLLPWSLPRCFRRPVQGGWKKNASSRSTCLSNSFRRTLCIVL
ncbi:hypothetical protein K435DRAFT_242172 [Dendrothele bispora CBS 962.96]|uniref:Uncharacterized protein n=1 Tax=Dendrothele bispora (strain CBS 962.96) TaxID=1314807 RepID=A0A4S8LP21_DENBC|nr:hypothetical protein K435DRAFT_242172 [Dendrothele bispora CBS 962.96]